MPQPPMELTTRSRLVGVGVQDALTACLVEGAGFDIAWVGSFEASTYRRLPDVNLITSTEMADSVRAVRSGCTLPVFVDADNGYGSDEAAIRALDLFAAAGASAMCLEDNAYPKRNSLYSLRERALEEREVFATRIARLSGRGLDVRIIARTEALVAGLGSDEAVRRLETYAEAGAHALFVQTNAEHAGQLADVVQRLAGRLPFVVAPTVLPHLTADEFHEMGANVVLFANVVSRAGIQGITRMLADLREGRSLGKISGHIADLGEVFRLTDALSWNSE